MPCFRQMLTLLSIISSSLFSTIAQGYSGTVTFSPDVPETISINEYETTRITILSYEPLVNRIWIETNPLTQGRELNVSFSHRQLESPFPTPGPTPSLFVLPGIPAGDYTFNLRQGPGVITDSRRLKVSATQSRLKIQSYTSNADAFVLATDYESARALQDGGGVLTETMFLAWPSTGLAPSGAKPVVRLKYRTQFVTNYFFTLDSRDITTLSSLPGWTNEGAVFRSFAPEFGVCPFDTQPIYRAFRGFNNRVTHRYTPDAAAYRDWISFNGWLGEGIAFCAPTK
jgi:hypothetical protein